MKREERKMRIEPCCRSLKVGDGKASFHVQIGRVCGGPGSWLFVMVARVAIIVLTIFKSLLLLMNIHSKPSPSWRVRHLPNGSTSSLLVTRHDDPVKWDEMKKVVEQFLSNTIILWCEAESDVLYESSLFNGEEISRDWFSFSEEVQSIFYFS